MNLLMNQAIQKRMNQLAQIPSLQAAVLVMHAAPDAEEFRYQARAANPEIWQSISSVSHRFRSRGYAELLNQPVVCAGQELQLLCETYERGRSFMIAATLPLPEAFDLSTMRNALEKVAKACLSEADSMKWR
jgi:hypothetical protein